MIQLDNWQKEVLDFEGDILLCTGRRVGKTYTLARKAIDYMAKHRNMPVVIVSLTEDQAMIIMSMALNYAKDTCPKLIGKGKYKPTLKNLYINGGCMKIRPVGNTGDGARGFEGGILIVDEAARMPKLFWLASKPILLTTNGKIWMCSTLFGKDSYFYERFAESYIKKKPDARFKVWVVTTEEVMNNRPISESWTEEQRIGALRLLEEDKKEMTRAQYAQEYLAIADDGLMNFFPEELIQKCCILKRRPQNDELKHYLGVDVGGLGEDKSSFEVITKTDSNTYRHTENITTSRTYTTQTTKKILELEQMWKFTKIGIDNAGIGAGVFHPLLVEDSTKRKVVGLSNAQKFLDKEGKKKATLAKEDMYIILKALMEQGKILLLDDPDIATSLRSLQQELVISENKKSTMRIFGRDTHIAEGLIRATWIAFEDKTLNMWAC